MLKKILKKLLLLISVVIISFALLSAIFRQLTPIASHYKPEIEAKISKLIAHPVKIDSIETGWYWFEPIIRLKNVRVVDDKHESPEVGSIFVGINLLSSLWQWRIQPDTLYIQDIHLSLHEKNQSWYVSGFQTFQSSNNSVELEKLLTLWFALHEKIVFKDISLSLHFANGTLIPINDLSLKIKNNKGHYLLKGQGELKQTQSSSFKLLADFYYDPFLAHKARGAFYFSASHMMPAQWQAFLEKKYRIFEGGRGDIRLWFDVAEGDLQAVQSSLNFKHLALRTPEKDERQLIQNLSTHLAWEKQSTGWQLLADKIRIRIGGNAWPRNQLKLIYDNEKQTYELSTQKIRVQSLLDGLKPWSASVRAVMPYDIHGLLKDTTLFYRQGELIYFISSFKKLGWRADDKLPAANNLAGVIHWQPDEARLSIDSKDALLAIKNYPAETFTQVNADLNWRKFQNGYRLNIEQLLLINPSLILNVQGVIHDITKDDVGEMNLRADFSGKHAEKWMRYLPKDHLKPKLYQWLTEDIEQIGRITGQMQVTGKLADFPFDNDNGVFQINTHLQNTALKFNSHWPLVKNIDAYLRLNHRQLEAEITHADLLEVSLDQLHLAINDLGLDKENLMIHTLANANGDSILDFVLQSPLKKTLSHLNLLDIKGPVDLDLNLQIGLYSPKTPVYAEGLLRFKNNDLTIRHRVAEVQLSRINGDLAFNEQGIIKSQLKAQAFDYPIDIALRSVKKPQHYTEIDIKSHIDMDDIRKKYPIKALDWVHGRLSSDLNIKITDDTEDLDQLQLRSDLKDIAIHLPMPYGKELGSEAPLAVDIAFNPEKAIYLSSNYNHLLSTYLHWSHQAQGFKFHSGEIRLGSAQAVRQEQQGLHLIGTIPYFDFNQWQGLLPTSDSNTENSLAALVDYVDLKFQELSLFNKQYQNFVLKARKSKAHWDIQLREKELKADLKYQPKNHHLQARVNRFHMQMDSQSKKNKTRLSDYISPSDFPELDISIDQFQLNEYQLGQLNFKTRSQADHFYLSNLQLNSPYYKLLAKGNWTKKDNLHQSHLEASVQIKDLENTLHVFNKPSVLESGYGVISFEGAWPGSLFDFSLASVRGTIDVELKNGRITHLSKETQDKMALGKLLSILSLQTIPRRLVLDFSDLSEEGFSFDIFKGNFNLKHGVLSIKDSYIDGPVAYGSVSGKLNVIDRYYDLQLKISPHITASLPVVATIAGGPIAGIATWIASKIIHKSMLQINAYTYKITGPWKEPVVQQLKIIHKKS